MMVKKAYKYILSLLISMICIFCMPFHIYADSFTLSNVVGVNVVGMEIVSNTQSDVTAEVILDDNYTGTFVLKCTYTLSGSTVSVQKQIFVNGNSAEFTFVNAGTTIPVLTPTQVSSVNVYRSSEFDFPVESLSAVMSLGLNGHTITNIDNVGKYKYPTFSLPQYEPSSPDESKICRFVINPANPKANSYVLIFGINKNIYNDSSLINAVTWDLVSGTRPQFEWVETLFRNNYAPYSIVKCRFYYSDSVQPTDPVTDVRFCSLNQCKFTPIYFNYEYPDNISLDFALNFHLENELLKALQQIGGNQQSQDSISDLDDSQSQLDSVVNNVDSYEQQFTSDFNDSLDQIDTDFQWGTNFLTSANWVRTQFNELTDNNIFGSLLTFSLILGLSLLIIGKVFK